MGAETWGADVAGPAAAACDVETAAITSRHAQNEGESGTNGGTTQTLESDRQRLEGVCADFGALGLAPPKLAKADVADEESRVRRPE